MTDTTQRHEPRNAYERARWNLPGTRIRAVAERVNSRHDVVEDESGGPFGSCLDAAGAIADQPLVICRITRSDDGYPDIQLRWAENGIGMVLTCEAKGAASIALYVSSDPSHPARAHWVRIGSDGELTTQIAEIDALIAARFDELVRLGDERFPDLARLRDERFPDLARLRDELSREVEVAPLSKLNEVVARRREVEAMVREKDKEIARERRTEVPRRPELG